MTAPGTSLATVATPVIGNLKERRVQLQAYLPKGVDIKSVLAQVHTAVIDNPKIADCIPQSVFAAVATCASWGANIGSEAYLVPYFNKQKGGLVCTPIIDYKYLCALVRLITGYQPVAECVFEGDLFDYEQGSNAFIRHRPASLMGRDKGKFRGVYAYIDQPGGKIIPIWIPADEAEAARQQYSQQWKSKPILEVLWWFRKWALKQLVKTMPKNPNTVKHFEVLVRAQRLVEEEETEVIIQDTNETHARIQASREPVSTDGEVLDELETPDFGAHEYPPASAAAPAAADEIQLDKARALLLPGEPGNKKRWGGKGGFRLDQLRTHMLVSLAEWCEKQIALGPQGLANAQELLDGARRVMKAYDKGELKEPAPSKPSTPPVGSESSAQLADRVGERRETVKAGVSVDSDSDEELFT